MSLTPFNILVIISIVLSIVALIKPAWPLTPVALILIGVALLIK